VNVAHQEETLIELVDREEKNQLDRAQFSAAASIMRSEVEAQLDAAHKYPRSITAFVKEATAMATTNVEIAEACMYSLPRGGKIITGPSVRLAEICASAYGNLQYGARIADVEEKEVVAVGAAWDMQKNNRCTIESRRRITKKNGTRYDDDMITVTGNAAASIALRNALFRVIPRAHVMTVYEAARRVAVGDASTMEKKREDLFARFQKMGISKERVLARLEKKGLEDIGLEDFEHLIGLGTAIKNGELSIEEAFPAQVPAPVEQSQDGRRIKLGAKKAEETEPSKTVDDIGGERS
jgi:hypothetical protein